MEHDSKDKGFRLVRQLTLEDGDSALVIEEVDADGKGIPGHRDALRIRRAGNEWRVVIGKHGPEKVRLPAELMLD